jgi:protein tyrosine/serine phosphatase
VKEVFMHLAGPAAENRAVLVHCSAGKDRAGCVVAVVLGVLGVPDEVIAEEYALTAVGMGPMKEYFVERVLEGGAFGEGEEARQRAMKMVTARKENMAATLAMLRRRWGGPEEYVKSVVGVDDEVIEAVRRNALVGAPGSSRALVGSEDRATL